MFVIDAFDLLDVFFVHVLDFVNSRLFVFFVEFTFEPFADYGNEFDSGGVK